jgi:hypothetical protein
MNDLKLNPMFSVPQTSTPTVFEFLLSSSIYTNMIIVLRCTYVGVGLENRVVFVITTIRHDEDEEVLPHPT